MTFLNIILLGGLAAASLPLLIHLFNKNRSRTVRWGAMHLLNATVETNKRRLLVEHWLLLIIRCLIPTLLALCMARPVFVGAAKLLGAEKSSLVILLDNSYSMDTGGAGNANFTQAREVAAKVIENAARGSELSVLLMAGGVTPLLDPPTFDAARLNQELARRDAGFGRATVPEALEAAAATLAKMSQPLRELVIITDFQRVSWSETEAASRARAAEQWRKLPLPPQVTLMPVGAEGRDNVSVDSLDFSRFVFGKGQPMQLRANLRNWGERDYPDLRVYFRVDGRERSASQVSLAAGESKQVLFTTTFDSAGSHFIEVYADADALKADNSYLAAVPVWDAVPTLLVNGDPSPEPLKGETDFLQIALQPFGQAKADLTDLITTQVIEARQLTPEALARTRVLVLANVRQLAEPQVRAVRDFVQNGGGLLVFPGNRVNTEWYSNTLFAAEKLLPLPLAALAGSLDDNGPRARIVAERYSHPALELFNDPRNGNLAEAEIKLWFKTGPRPADADRSLNVLAQLDTGDAFLVERAFGEGRVMLCATPCDADWSTLPVRPFYLPLMQRLVTYLASTVFPPRNVEVGKPLAAFFPSADAGKHAAFTDPAGERHEVPIVLRGTRGFTEFAKTQRPGLYVMTAPDGAATHFVVNTSREESDLRQLTEPERAAVAKAMGAKLVNSVKEYQQLDTDRRFGQEIWRPLLWLVLALVFVELVLEQYFGRKK